MIRKMVLHTLIAGLVVGAFGIAYQSHAQGDPPTAFWSGRENHGDED